MALTGSSIDKPVGSRGPASSAPSPLAAGDDPGFPLAIAALVLLTQFGLGLNLFSVSPLLPLATEDYNTSNTVTSLLVAGPVLLQALFGLPGSLLVARWGVRRTLLTGAAMVTVAVATTLATGFAQVMVLRLIGGAGAGLVLAGTGPTIAGRFSSRHLPLMNTLFLVALSGGIAVGVATAAPLAERFGWENALALFGLAMAVPLLGWIVSGIDPGVDDTLTDFDSDAAPSTAEAARLFDLSRIRAVLSDRTVAGLVTSDALVFVQYAVLTSWLPTFLSEDRGLSLERAGFLTGLLPAVGMVAVVVGGLITHRFPQWRLMLGVAGVFVGVSGFATFLLASPGAIAAAIVVLGIATWIYQPAFHTVPMRLPWMTAEGVAVVWGASMTVAGIGQFLAPIVVGASRDLFGSFIPGFAVWSILAWSLPVFALWVGSEAPATEADTALSDTVKPTPFSDVAHSQTTVSNTTRKDNI